MRTISKFLLPSIVGVNVYLVIHKFFPEKVKSFYKGPMTSIMGDDYKIKLFPKIFRAIMKDKVLKIWIIATFGTAALTFF